MCVLNHYLTWEQSFVKIINQRVAFGTVLWSHTWHSEYFKLFVQYFVNKKFFGRSLQRVGFASACWPFTLSRSLNVRWGIGRLLKLEF